MSAFPYCFVVTILTFRAQSPDVRSETEKCLEMARNFKKAFVRDSPVDTCSKEFLYSNWSTTSIYSGHRVRQNWVMDLYKCKISAFTFTRRIAILTTFSFPLG